MIDLTDIVTRPLPIAAPTVFYFQSPKRLYRAELTQGLLNDWTVIMSWSGRNSRRGGRLTKVVPDPEAGMEMLRAVVKARERRGYKLTCP